MNELEVKKKTFKFFGFEEFPLEELRKIDDAIKNIGYEGSIISNGNIVYRKVEK